MRPIKSERVDSLNVQVYKDRLSAGIAAGHDVASKLKELLLRQERVRMVFAAAPSQKEFLQTLVAVDGIDWSRVIAFQMDEYLGIPSNHPQTFSRFLSRHLFDYVKPGSVHFINSSSSPHSECVRYSKLLQEEPIDIVCLGIGENGHIAFNDPPVADFNDPEIMKPVKLDDFCRQQQVNDGCFPNVDDVPTHALTMTIPILMSGKFLYCIVPGKTKRNAIDRALNGPITVKCPASILRNHTHCTLYTEKDAYGL